MHVCRVGWDCTVGACVHVSTRESGGGQFLDWFQHLMGICPWNSSSRSPPWVHAYLRICILDVQKWVEGCLEFFSENSTDLVAPPFTFQSNISLCLLMELNTMELWIVVISGKHHGQNRLRDIWHYGTGKQWLSCKKGINKKTFFRLEKNNIGYPPPIFSTLLYINHFAISFLRNQTP